MVMVSQHKAGEPLAGLKNPDQNVQAPPENLGATLDVGDQQLLITDSCWNRIRQLAHKKNLSLQSVYLRVYVDAGGCSGFSYKFEIDESPVIEEGEDVVFRHPDIPDLRVVVDSTSLELIRGSTIDYVEEMIKSSFEVRNNPQSESACGCGSSFALKNFAANPAVD
jgi:iron-sulfur cluster assembly accessory protein